MKTECPIVFLMCDAKNSFITMKHLLLKGKTVVYADWANVYGWRSSLKREVDARKLFAYLKSYPEVADIRLYYGEDRHPKSSAFLRECAQTGYTVVSKEVKYILIAEVEGQKLYRKKCDFDMEISIDVHNALEEGVESFVFLTGDGDFAPLYRKLIALGKRVIVVYADGHLGREVWDIKKGIFKIEIDNLLEI